MECRKRMAMLALRFGTEVGGGVVATFFTVLFFLRSLQVVHSYSAEVMPFYAVTVLLGGLCLAGMWLAPTVEASFRRNPLGTKCRWDLLRYLLNVVLVVLVVDKIISVLTQVDENL